LGVPKQVRPQHVLRLGADVNDALAAVVLGLVVLGAILPDVTGTVDVGGSQAANLARTAASKHLEADHIGHDRGQVF
jgi:hypothetical protein